ncbi:MAG: DUF2071 domain-containing protein [Planctomycetes bacterium]|nr:DUF2071 domain-containing protein [Planctomycetota bacterium]
MLVPASLGETAHRPYPPPQTRWSVRQTWYRLLFAHWRVDARKLALLLPKPLELDLYRGEEAWVGIVPFGMKRVAPRGLPALPWISKFLELNVRTYVRLGNKPGVYFFSLDAANPLAVEVARAWFQLPYLRARMGLELRGGWNEYRSQRTDARAADAELQTRYQPQGLPFVAARGSLESFLVDRYRLFTAKGGVAHCAEIHHGPWPLQRARADFGTNTMARASGIEIEAAPPHLLYAQEIAVHAWSPTIASG